MAYAILKPDGSLHRVVLAPLPGGATDHAPLGVLPVDDVLPTGFIRTGWRIEGGVVLPNLEPVASTTYSRDDYKAALDEMLAEQCHSYEFDGVATLANYLFEPNAFYDKARWLSRLNVFTWVTSDQLAAQPPAGDPPTPPQFAALILSMFEGGNPRP